MNLKDMDKCVHLTLTYDMRTTYSELFYLFGLFMVFGDLIALTALVATLQGFLDCGLFSLLLVQWLPLGACSRIGPAASSRGHATFN